MHSLRIRLIKALVDINEKLFFERRLLRFYKEAIGKGAHTVIDVGANKGQSIDFFLKLNNACRIYAIEPNPELFEGLKNRYAIKQHVHLFRLGISNINGEREFQENVLDYTSSFEELNSSSAYLARKAKILGVDKSQLIVKRYPVHVMTLLDFIRHNKLPHIIDILKIDTEGHEYACLEGLFHPDLKSKIRYIQLENHTDDMYSKRIPYEKMKELLKVNGFFEEKVILHGYSRLEEVIFKNAHVSM